MDFTLDSEAALRLPKDDFWDWPAPIGALPLRQTVARDPETSQMCDDENRAAYDYSRIQGLLHFSVSWLLFADSSGSEAFSEVYSTDQFGSVFYFRRLSTASPVKSDMAKLWQYMSVSILWDLENTAG
jgi:hypothetical protein